MIVWNASSHSTERSSEQQQYCEYASHNMAPRHSTSRSFLKIDFDCTRLAYRAGRCCISSSSFFIFRDKQWRQQNAQRSHGFDSTAALNDDNSAASGTAQRDRAMPCKAVQTTISKRTLCAREMKYASTRSLWKAALRLVVVVATRERFLEL
jgi:hypothetical protein